MDKDITIILKDMAKEYDIHLTPLKDFEMKPQWIDIAKGLPSEWIDYPWAKTVSPTELKPVEVESKIPEKSSESSSKKSSEPTVPESILDLVPGSVSEDWHQHINSLVNTVYDYTSNKVEKIGGYVYKNAIVHPSAIISSCSTIYDNAEIGADVQVLYSSKIYGNAKVLNGVLYHSSEVFGNAIVHPNIGCIPTIEDSKISGNTQIFHKSFISGSNISGDVILKNNSQVYNSTVSGNVSLFGSSKILQSGISGVVTLFDSAELKNAHFIGKNYIARKGSTHEQIVYNITPNSYRTQKARGVRALIDFGLLNTTVNINKIEEVIPAVLIGYFSRPCPKTPRHGFVDSKLIKSEEEAIQLVSDTKAADSESEIMYMAPYFPKYSGVWTEGSISIGEGNDGATSGKNSVTLPILGAFTYPEKYKMLCEFAGIKESAYAEILWLETDIYHNGNLNKVYIPEFVQLRDGPKLPRSVDYIPQKVTITEVVLAEGSLLEWESKVKTFKPGTVVYHPGGNLASHYSVHCVINNIPVFISYKPEIGAEIRAGKGVNPKPDFEKIRQGFVYALKSNISYMSATYAMLVGCHSISVWLGREDFLLGFSLGCTFRLTVIAAIGEYRHYAENSEVTAVSRERVYRNLWNKTYTFKTRRLFLEALSVMKKRKHSPGIGGPKWYEYGNHAILILNYLIEGDTNKALETMNSAINAVHNAGWGFNKFADNSVLDEAAESPAIVMMKVAPIFYTTKQYVQKMNGTNEFKELSRFFINRRKWELDMPSQVIGPFPEICGCDEHDCTSCYPKGCTCMYKECHDCLKCGKCCNCGRHHCIKCYPNGCECKNMFCHDCGKCRKCCGCLKHTCKKCYPYGCPCVSKSCHDCNQPNCAYCTKSYVTEVQVRLSKEGSLRVHYKLNNVTGYKYFTKNIPSNNLLQARDWIDSHSIADSWTGTNLIKYCPLIHSGDKWFLGAYPVELPFPSLKSCTCGNHYCTVCHPHGCDCCCNKCHISAEECICDDSCDCNDCDCDNCYPDGCNCKCVNCHDSDKKCSECCNCSDHKCTNCYSDGCGCADTDCHDCGKCNLCIALKASKLASKLASEPGDK